MTNLPIGTSFRNYSKTSREEIKFLNAICFKIYPINDSQAIIKEKKSTDFSSSLYEAYALGRKKIFGKIILHYHLKISYIDKIDQF